MLLASNRQPEAVAIVTDSIHNSHAVAVTACHSPNKSNPSSIRPS